MTGADQRDATRLPERLEVWVCPVCGYWRQRKETGVHMNYDGSGPGICHTLIKVPYRLALDEERRS